MANLILNGSRAPNSYGKRCISLLARYIAEVRSQKSEVRSQKSEVKLLPYCSLRLLSCPNYPGDCYN
ncbi:MULTISPECIES: hypothetical protein [Moorena]|uniref:hypothetical protein n=1 Tax=Moorena TaxID=1155738 RepID=UPI0010554A1E|nr:MULTISPECIES: hypothetical protein [Moorena]NES45788.1 hypothetical protein [Moorena sp. SIO2C4]